MDIFFRIFLLALSGVFLILLLKKERPEWGVLLSVSLCCLLLFTLWPQLKELVDSLSAFTPLAGQSNWLGPVLKMAGAAFVGEWGVQACKDAGENAIAYKLELSTKVVILVLAMPLITQILQLIAHLLTGENL